MTRVLLSARIGFGSLLGLCGICIVGCQFGPSALKVGNAHYSDAVRVAQGEQLLVNLVRLHYRDLPVFLSVSSISTQFQFDSSADISGSIVENVGTTNANTPDTLGLGGRVGYSERPTITFSILGGEAFQQRMLAPLRLPAISLVSESGWRVDRVLRITAEGLNGLKNAPSASGPTPSREPEFRKFLEATRLMQDLISQGLIEGEYVTRPSNISSPIPVAQVDGGNIVDAAKAGTEFLSTGEGGDELQLSREKRVLVMRFAPAAKNSADVMRLKELLQLAPNRNRFDIVALEDSELNAFDDHQQLDELAIDARSLMGVLYFLSHAVQPPAEHLESGIVTQTVAADGSPFDWSILLDDLFTVHSSSVPPRRAAVAVQHRGYWFYIADDDETSKSTFLLLSQLFTLQAGQVSETKPVLTLPVGG
jgi:hypothetical protein